MAGRALKLALAASAVGQFLATPVVLAQQGGTDQSATELAPMIVTGSMIPQMDTIIASPVEVVDATKIEKIGATDALDLLRRTTPVFVGNGNTGQEVNNGGGGESYIALRNLPTLVLLNGRRLANSGFSNGAAVDVNTIPVSAIERVEVFKDGASAIYGADAIGGVVNIITKKNFQGVEVKGRWGTTTRDDSWNEVGASAVAGFGDDKGTVTAGAAYYKSDALLSQDRAVASLGIQELAAKGLNPPSYISPTYAGRFDNYVLAGSEYAKGAPGYNPAITTIPDAYLGKKLTIADLAAAGVIVPLSQTTLGQQVDAAGVGGYPLINTTLLGTHSIQSQDRRQFFGTFERDLYEKHLQFFGDFLYSDTKSEGMLAASPAPALSSYGITVPADNPYNPFGVTLGTGGASSPRIRNRFVDLGNRVFRYDSSTYHFVTGLKGQVDVGADWIENLEWHGAFNYNKSDQLNRNSNSGTSAALNQALTPDFSASPDGKLSMLTDDLGPVPTYNYFALPGHNDPRTLNAIRTTLFSKSDSELYSFDAGFSARAGALPAGKIGWAAGAEYRHEALELSSDYLTQTGQGIGYNAAGNFPGGARGSRSVFVETSIPVFSPDWNLPGLQSLEISAAGRFEELSPGGSAAVPRVGIKWKPLDEGLTLRATYSEGYIAPTIYQLFGPAGDNNPYIVLPDAPGGTPTALQETFSQRSSADIPASPSTSWTGGFALNPKGLSGLLLTVDYYTIDQPVLYTYDWQGYVNSLNTLGTASPYYSQYRDVDGNRVTGPNQLTDATWGTAVIERTPGGQRTDGFDIAAQYRHETETLGDFTIYANANIVMSYEFATGGKYYHYEGLYTQSVAGSQGAIPDYTIVTGLNWDYKDLSYGISARYVPPMQDLGLLHPVLQGLAGGHGQTVDGGVWNIQDWFTIDMQVSYEFGRSHPTKDWYNGFKATVGVQNITDEDPPFVASSTEDYTDKATYSILGRMIYFEFSKKF
jgi:iron complex outermembrane receptor protein